MDDLNIERMEHVACDGDMTSTDGRVVAKEPHMEMSGRNVAAIGDYATCPICIGVSL